MKKLLFSLATVALLLATPRVSQGVDVSFDFFYNNLSGGSWIEVGDYGYCWQPDVVVSNSSWRPYADGYWAYTDLGWTWVSYEDFGWATYHYGRWILLDDYGWCWAPGRDSELEWGPAWVSWRTGGDYIGWAPLPPEVTITGRPIITGQIDADFDIGPGYYNFIEVRYIGEPVLRERIVPVTQNVTYIQQTVNVTKITYTNNAVYNYGPDVNLINARAAHPIQRLKLERQENVDPVQAAKSGALTKVQGDKLVVSAPMKVKRAAQLPPPPALKAKVAQPKIDKGWKVVSDENTRAQLRQKLKAEDTSKIPPPTQAGAAGQANVNAVASPAAAGASPAASPQIGTAQEGRGQGKQRGRRGEQPGAETAGGASPAASVSPSAAPGSEAVAGGRGRGQEGGGRRDRQGRSMDQNVPADGGSAAETGAAQNVAPGQADQGQGRGRRSDRGQQQFPGATPATTGAETRTGAGINAPEDQSRGGARQNRRQLEQGNAPAGGQADQGQGQRMQRQPAETAPGDVQGQGGRGRQQGQGQGQGQEQREGKKGKQEPSPGAPPQ